MIQQTTDSNVAAGREEISFEGQAVIITGAGGGLGAAYAKEIARRGGGVIVNDFGGSVSGAGSESSTRYADDVVEKITDAGGLAFANYDTVTTPEGARRIGEAALDHFGRIDAVIANAGNFRFGDFESLSFEDLNALLAVHVGGSWNIAQAAWPEMKRRKYGRIVFTTSSAGMLGNAKLAAYGAAKGGVMGLMHGLAEAGLPHGILCNAIMPNAMSRMTSTLKHGDLDDNPWAAAMGRYFDPRYTAGLASFLASGACTTHHGIYSLLGGRLGRTFVAVTRGFAEEATLDAETIAAHWSEVRDDQSGYAIPANVADEFRIVAEQRGMNKKT